MTIDWSRMETREARADRARADLRQEARDLCRARILAVCNETAQTNLAAAAAAGLLTPRDMAIYRVGMVWVATMRAAWGPLADAGADLRDDANWPPVPPGVAELGGRF
jgi:hypothetical protein